MIDLSYHNLPVACYCIIEDRRHEVFIDILHRTVVTLDY